MREGAGACDCVQHDYRIWMAGQDWQQCTVDNGKGGEGRGMQHTWQMEAEAAWKVIVGVTYPQTFTPKIPQHENSVNICLCPVRKR